MLKKYLYPLLDELENLASLMSVSKFCEDPKLIYTFNIAKLVEQAFFSDSALNRHGSV